jgi:ribosomal RNA assembly protein
MTETFIFEKIGSLKKAKDELEQKLGIKILIEGKKITIEGEAIKEYEAKIILDAINFGFKPKQALILKNESYVFKKVNIKDFTRRKNLKDVRGRIIGTEGKTKRTIENVANCEIIVKDNEVGIIGAEEHINDAVTAITNLARGTKQANVYRFLERMNVARKDKIDLGLKSGKSEEE